MILCLCGKPKSRKALTCAICRADRFNTRDRERAKAKRIERKLALIDALKRRARWAA